MIGKEDYNVYTDTDSVFYQGTVGKARNPELNEDSDEEMIPDSIRTKEVEQQLRNVRCYEKVI